MTDEQRNALLLVLEHIDLSGVAERDPAVAEAVKVLEAMLYPEKQKNPDAGAPDIQPDEVSVYLYFTTKLEVPPNDSGLQKLGTRTNCGCDCVRAIDAAAALMEHVAAAGCEGRGHILTTVNAVIETYWRG